MLYALPYRLFYIIVREVRLPWWKTLISCDVHHIFQGFQSTTSIMWLMLIWFMLPVHALVSGPTCAGNISSTEYAALQGLYSSTGGPNWLWHSGLNQSTQQWVFPSRLSAPCEDHWEGISCGIQSVMSIEHGDTCYIASLVLPSTNLRGRLPSCLGSLSRLSTLDLEDNSLTGSIPSQRGGLISLAVLDLYSNSLTGSFVSQVRNLTSLIIFSVGVNLLTGPIPSSLGLLTKLTTMDLSYNHLTGSIPSQLAKLNNLIILKLFANVLQHRIPPELGMLTSLNVMEIDENSITGSIPSEWIR